MLQQCRRLALRNRGDVIGGAGLLDRNQHAEGVLSRVALRSTSGGTSKARERAVGHRGKRMPRTTRDVGRARDAGGAQALHDRYTTVRARDAGGAQGPRGVVTACNGVVACRTRTAASRFRDSSEPRDFVSQRFASAWARPVFLLGQGGQGKTSVHVGRVQVVCECTWCGRTCREGRRQRRRARGRSACYQIRWRGDGSGWV